MELAVENARFSGSYVPLWAFSSVVDGAFDSLAIFISENLKTFHLRIIIDDTALLELLQIVFGHIFENGLHSLRNEAVYNPHQLGFHHVLILSILIPHSGLFVFNAEVVGFIVVKNKVEEIIV